MENTVVAAERFGGRSRRRMTSRMGGALVAGHWRAIARAAGIQKNPKTGLFIPGPVKWEEEWHNLVVNQGLDYLLDAGLSAGTQITSWFILLLDGTPTVAAGDTLASHAGWTEVTAYDEATRQAWTDGGVSGQSVDNSGSPAQFTISANGTTIGGAALASNSTKGGTTGTLYAAGAFTAGDKTLDDGDTLDVTATFTQADDGA